MDSLGVGINSDGIKKPTGIGASLRTEDYYTLVSYLVPGGAAARHGKLEAGDRIIAVAQADLAFESIIDMPIKNVV